MKFFLKIFLAFFTGLTSMQLQALPRHLTNHHNKFFQQQPKKNQKENAKIHANSNSIIGSNNVKKNEAKKDQPKISEVKTNEKVNKKKK